MKGFKMFWFKFKITNAFANSFRGGSGRDRERDGAEALAGLRKAMLEVIPRQGGERAFHLAHRIRYAQELEDLWFMRGALTGLLAREHGEAVAFQIVHELSERFSDQLPSGLRSRPSPLTASLGSSAADEPYADDDARQ